MRTPRRHLALALAACLLGLPARAAQPAGAVATKPATTTVILQTALGDIHIALETERAPNTAKNFLAYVDAGRFNGITFYRAVRSRDGTEGLVQGGLRNNLRNAFPPVVHESTVATGLSHVDGAISMAYRGIPGSARGEFFIVVGDMLTYDGVPDGGDPGFAVFGRVTQGMNIVRRILRMPTQTDARNPSMQGQMLSEPVTILTARRAP